MENLTIHNTCRTPQPGIRHSVSSRWLLFHGTSLFTILNERLVLTCLGHRVNLVNHNRHGVDTAKYYEAAGVAVPKPLLDEDEDEQTGAVVSEPGNPETESI